MTSKAGGGLTGKARGRQLAASLASVDEAEAEAAFEALRTAPPSVTDPAAREMRTIIEGGGERAIAVCEALARANAPGFGGRSWSVLFAALTKAQGRGGALGTSAGLAMQALVRRGDDTKYLEKRANERPPASTNVFFRVASVAKRIWVWVVYPMTTFFIFALGAMSESGYLLPTIGALVLALVIVGVDALLRRCPSCRKLLAGELLSIVVDGSYTRSVQVGSGGQYADQTVNTHGRSWRCVFCKHRWST